jgi:hypothetical protein
MQRTGIHEQISNIWLLQQASKSTRREMHKEATYLRLTEYEIIRILQMQSQKVSMLNIADVFKGLLLVVNYFPETRAL